MWDKQEDKPVEPKEETVVISEAPKPAPAPVPDAPQGWGYQGAVWNTAVVDPVPAPVVPTPAAPQEHAGPSYEMTAPHVKG